MSVTLTGTGGLFTRLGQIFGRTKDANTYLAAGDLSSGGLRSVGVGANNIEAQYASALQNLTTQLYDNRDSARSALDAWKTAMRSLAEQTLIEQVHADTPLAEKTVKAALKVLIFQMLGAGTLADPDNSCTTNGSISDTPVAGSAVTGNTGNGSCFFTNKRFNGMIHQHVIAESVDVICTSDEDLGATSRQEPFDVIGKAAVDDQLAWNWPAGSGASTSLSAIDSEQDNSGNLLTNSDFYDVAVANTPDNWTVLVGAAGTDIFSEVSTIYRTGKKALKFTGTGGAPLSSIAQTMNVTSGGTAGALVPNTIYAVNCWVRKSTSLVAGILHISLVDGSNVVITDDFGTNCETTIAYSSLTTSYAALKLVLVTPKVLPATYKLRVRVSTALTSGESVYVADLAMAEMTELYPEGPSAAVFAGATPFAKNDAFTLAVGNSAAGVFQTYFQRVFDMRSLGLQIPYEVSASINDNLVT